MYEFNKLLEKTNTQKLTDYLLTGMDNTEITDLNFEKRQQSNRMALEREIKKFISEFPDRAKNKSEEQQLDTLFDICFSAVEKSEVLFLEMGMLLGAKLIYELLLKKG